MKRHIPNLITSLNLIAGFTAIIFAVEGDLTTSSWLILAAMIFDFLDGFSARLLNSYSEVGKELDSLADVISFGVAPAIIIFYLLKSTLSLYSPLIIGPDGTGTMLILLSPAVMPLCAALRLAIFNTDDSQASSFKGLPTPANALAVISLVVAASYSDSSLATDLTGSPLALMLFTVILSLLMVSRLPLLSLKMHNIKLRGNKGRYLLILLVAVSFIIFGILGALLIIPLYIVVSIISFSFR